MLAVIGLGTTMHSNMVHNIAYFVELSTAGRTNENLVRATCDEVVPENLYESFIIILINFFSMTFTFQSFCNQF